MPQMTLEDLIAAYGPVLNARPSSKPRDPEKRAILSRFGDPIIDRESVVGIRLPGERAMPSNSVKKT